MWQPKSMRNIEDIMADYIADPTNKLSVEEERLLDRTVHAKTGKHIGRFKDKKPKPTDNMVTVSAHGKDKAQFEPSSKTGRPQKEPKISSKVITKGSVS